MAAREYSFTAELEAYQRQNPRSAARFAEAQQVLASLPLVQAGLITFEVIPLVPYPGFARLFEK